MFCVHAPQGTSYRSIAEHDAWFWSEAVKGAGVPHSVDMAIEELKKMLEEGGEDKDHVLGRFAGGENGMKPTEESPQAESKEVLQAVLGLFRLPRRAPSRRCRRDVRWRSRSRSV